MNDINNFSQPQATFLLTRMLDEMVAFIVTHIEIKEKGSDGLEISYEGEDPQKKLEFVEKHFDAYKHLNIGEFVVNLGSYLSEMIRVFELTGIGEFGILMEHLAENIDNIHYAGSVIHRIESERTEHSNSYLDFA